MEARNSGVSPSDIDAMNFWRNVENAKGKGPQLHMMDHYSDIKMRIPSLLRFSACEGGFISSLSALSVSFKVLRRPWLCHHDQVGKLSFFYSVSASTAAP